MTHPIVFNGDSSWATHYEPSSWGKVVRLAQITDLQLEGREEGYELRLRDTDIPSIKKGIQWRPPTLRLTPLHNQIATEMPHPTDQIGPHKLKRSFKPLVSPKLDLSNTVRPLHDRLSTRVIIILGSLIILGIAAGAITPLMFFAVGAGFTEAGFCAFIVLVPGAIGGVAELGIIGLYESQNRIEKLRSKLFRRA
jgi:hypothetical protein